jgi:hypothetical protein
MVSNILHQSSNNNSFRQPLEGSIRQGHLPELQTMQKTCNNLKDSLEKKSKLIMHQSSRDYDADEFSIQSSDFSTEVADEDYLLNSLEFDKLYEDVHHDNDEEGSTCSEKYIRSGTMSKECCDLWIQEDDTMTNQLHGKKSVRFEILPNGKIACHVHSNFKLLYNHEHKFLWYRKHDFKRFRQEAHKEAANACKSARVNDGSTSSSSSSSPVPYESIDIAQSKYRCYELTIFDASLFPCKMDIVEEVLNLQKQLKRRGKTAEKTWETLGKHSRRLSQLSRELALLLGQEDAKIALEINKDVSNSFFRRKLGKIAGNKTLKPSNARLEI